MKLWIARNSDNTLVLFKRKPESFYEEGVGQYWVGGYGYFLPRNEFPEVTFENSPSEVEIIEKSTLDEVYKGLDQYENFLGMVACMRRAQKEANDMIAQVECYEEAMDYVKKAEELESMVDKWLEGEAL